MLEKENKRLKENEIENERGRSMVEMLGVLAIMGVLAIGGIAGYRYAMDKYNANEILNEVRKRAITASQQRIFGKEISFSEYENNGKIIGLYDIVTADNHDGNSGYFTLTIQDIPKGICSRMITDYLPFAIWESIGGQDIDDLTECPNETNDILFAFANDLDLEGKGVTDEGDTSDTSDSSDTSDTSDTSDSSDADDCMWSSSLDDCIPCSVDGAFQVSQNECERCSNRVYGTVDGYLYGCFKCDDKAYPSIGGLDAWECGKCKGVRVFSPGYNSCDITGDSNMSDTEDQNCDDGFRDHNGNCYPCSYFGEPTADASECNKCSNRFVGWHTPGLDRCFPCDINIDGNAIHINSESDCLKCGNRFVNEFYVCDLCPRDMSSLDDSVKCSQCGGKWNNGVCSAQ